MRLKSKLLIGLLTANLIMGGGVILSPSNVAYATSTTTNNDKFNQQRTQLQLAVDDMVNVVNTNAYFNYASQESKNTYEMAIGNAQTVLARGENASYEELRNATIRINDAKKQVENEVTRIVKKQKLQNAINRNKIKVAAARHVINNYPETIKNIRPQLEELIANSERLLQKAEAAIARI